MSLSNGGDRAASLAKPDALRWPRDALAKGRTRWRSMTTAHASVADSTATSNSHGAGDGDGEG